MDLIEAVRWAWEHDIFPLVNRDQMFGEVEGTGNCSIAVKVVGCSTENAHDKFVEFVQEAKRRWEEHELRYGNKPTRHLVIGDDFKIGD